MAQQFDEWTPKSKGRTALSKKNSDTKKYNKGSSARLGKNGTGTDQKGRSARGQKKRLSLYLLVGQMLGSL